MSTEFVVSTAVDENDGDFTFGNLSLREAVLLANGSAGRDAISFNIDAMGTSIIRLMSEIEITEGLDFVPLLGGVTGSRVTISGDGAGDDPLADQDSAITALGAARASGTLVDNTRLFNITNADASVSFEDMIMTGGFGFFGGSGGLGGAVRSTGEVTLRNTIVQGNGTEGQGASGGAIHADTVFVLDSSLISRNATYGDDANGGAINANTLVVDGSTMSLNNTNGDRAAGGAVFAGTVSVSDSEIAFNTTTGSSAIGGAIRATGAVSISDTQVVSNSTTGFRSFGGAVQAFGGGTIENSEFSGNFTAGEFASGGAIQTGSFLEISGSEIVGNETRGDNASGGGVWFFGNGAIRDTIVRDNKTRGEGSDGGGLATRDESALLQVSGSQIEDNSTSGPGTRGGGIFARDLAIANSAVISNIAGNDSAGIGGGIAALGQLDVYNTTVALNETPVGVGFESLGAGIAIFGTADIAHTTIAGNGTNAGSGGGIFLGAGADLDIANSLVFRNSASAALGQSEIYAAQGSGASLRFLGGNILGRAEVGVDTVTGTATIDLRPEAENLIFATSVFNLDRGGAVPVLPLARVLANPAIDAGGRAPVLDLEETVYGIDLDGDGDAEDRITSPTGLIAGTDARGMGFGRAVGRPNGEIPDLGAFEVQDPLIGPTSGNDFLPASVLDETIRGGDGDDTIEAGGGFDFLSGDAGTDTLSFDRAENGIEIDLGGQISIAEFEAALDRSVPVEPLSVPGFGGQFVLSGFENLVGSRFGDRLTGTEDANRVAGGEGDDVLFAAGGDDTLLGGPGNDTLEGGAGNDRMIGGPGDDSYTESGGDGDTDTWVVEGTRDDVTVASGPLGFLTVSSPVDGTDTVAETINRVEVSDGVYIFDLPGEDDDIGFVYRVYDAAFARTPDEAGLRFWNGQVASGNIDRSRLSEAFVDSPEFDFLFPSSTDEQFIDALYQNALRRDPDPPGEAFWLAVFAMGTLTRADMLEFFADSPENIERNAENYDMGVWVV